MKNILIIAAHPDDEILGCGGTILKNVKLRNRVNVLYISDGVGGRYENKSNKKKSDIIDRKNMAIKASKLAKFKIVDFLGLENLELNKYKHNYINNKIFDVLKNIKPDTIYTNHPGDNNIDHRITFESTFTACRPNNYFKIKEFYTFEIPSSTDWASPSNIQFLPKKFVDITNFYKKKRTLLNFYKKELREHPHPRSIKNIDALETYRGGICGVKKAEAFDIIKIIE
ncbi:PIG-L family deacetylase [Pelagibacterales bacterium SAG-MED12]|nr:PIG-L family deacetylase [Pelagibacterales bacterium SAG-MED12]